MQVLQEVILQHVPHKHRVTNQGWIWFNAPCCVHRGHKPDTRMRGNLKLGVNGDAGYHCFNCGCKWRFNGEHVSEQLQEWLHWINVDPDQIQRIKLEILKSDVMGSEPNTLVSSIMRPHRLTKVDLPQDAQPLHVAQSEHADNPLVSQAVAYIQSRGDHVAHAYEYYWSASDNHDLSHRVILPFWHHADVVGWSARWSGEPPPGKSKYWNSQIPTGYLFNQNVLLKPRKWVLVCEGPFDAISCDGVAVMGSHMSEHQIQTLTQHDAQPIILPDRTRRNQDLIDQALAFGWWVSFPDWESDVKDAADACRKYGVIYTITSALQARTQSELEIGIKRKMFRGS